MNQFVTSAINYGTTTVTENGDKTFSTSLDANVDLFFQIGALRGADPMRIKTLFSAAFAEDKELASRILLWTRDIRGGAGERRSFKIILEYLIQHDLETALKVANKISELGRWDDLFVLFDDHRARDAMFSLIKDGLNNPSTAGLVAKWLPREVGNKRTKKVNDVVVTKPFPAARLKKNEIARAIREHLQLTPAEYRRMLSRLSKTVENDMCAKKWGEIKYDHVPSVASARYGKAFGRHDQARYADYLESVKKGEKKINTGALYPYDITRRSTHDAAADALWNNLPDYVPDGISFIPMIDVSGSMATPADASRNRWAIDAVQCLDVSVSLGIYLAERNKSAFKNLAMTFNNKPRMFQIPGGTIKEKVKFVKGSDRDMHGSTDLDLAFNLILNVALTGKVAQTDMPTHLIVLSDMEFNGKGRTSNGYYNTYGTTSVAERTKEAFKAAGYKLPNIIWWNIQSRHGNTPVRATEDGMALVSGFSPAVMKGIMRDEMNPRTQMLQIIMQERYSL